MAITTGILLFDDAEELDFVGPLGGVHDGPPCGREDDRVVTIAERAEPVRAAKGLRVIPDHAFADAPPLDVLLVPGGQGTRTRGRQPRADRLAAQGRGALHAG